MPGMRSPSWAFLMLAALAATRPAPAQGSNERELAAGSARAFFDHLLAAETRKLVEHSAFPFQLEDRRLATPEEALNEWQRQLGDKRTDLLTLYGIELLTPAEMEKKYGKPPARLASFPWRGHGTFLAVANLSGRAAVAVLRDRGEGYLVVGYHD